MISESIFNKIGANIVVRDLLSPISRYYSFDTPLLEINEDMGAECFNDDEIDPEYSTHFIAVITEQKRPVGYLAFDSSPIDVPEDAENARDVMHPIFERTISAGCTYTEVLNEFGTKKQPFLFVEDNGAIVGIVGYRDLFKPLGKIVLFSLIQELESAANDLCMRFAQQCFSVLPEGRQKKSFETLQQKLSKRKDKDFVAESRWVYYQLIESTMFIDKAAMIKKCKLLSDWSNNNITSVFERAEKLRNSCAHPTRAECFEEILEINKLNEFINDCQQLTSSIRLHNR